MPEFPRYNSERSLTTKQPRAMHPGADIRNEAGALTKRAKGAVDDFSKTLMAWNKNVERVQTDTALYNYKMDLQEISNDAVNEQDITKLGDYQKRLAKLKEQVLGSVGSNHVKNQMAAELNYMESVGNVGLQKEFRQKVIIHDQARATGELDNAARTGNIYEVERITAKAVEDGTWNELEAEKRRIQYSSKARMSAFTADLNANPKQTKQNLKKNILKEIVPV